MNKSIEINIHNRNNINLFSLIIGIGLLIVTAFKFRELWYGEPSQINFLKLTLFLILSIINLMAGFGFNLSRLFKIEKLVIVDSILLYDGFFKKKKLAFEKIDSIRLKNKTLTISSIDEKKLSINLTFWDKNNVLQLMDELENLTTPKN